MLKKAMLVAGGSLLIGLSFGAAAHGGGGGGGAGGGFGGGAPAAHASHEASMNSNGAFSSDRDKGQQRAEDRRSTSGASHEKAQDNRAHNNSKHAKNH